MNKSLQAILLAAGKSSRFKTNNTKLGYTLCGQELILYPVKLLNNLSIPTTVVIGHQKEKIQQAIVQARIENIDFIEQNEQNGTGHAVLCTQKNWFAENILIMSGDTPLIKQETIEHLIQKHKDTHADISFITAHNTNPSLITYDRIIKKNNIITIVEGSSYSGDTTIDCCINTGIYLIKKTFLEEALPLLQPHANGELYLTDLIIYAAQNGKKYESMSAPFDTIRGINTLKELWAAEHIKRSELIEYWMDRGVYFSAAQNVYLDINVSIGTGSFIGAGVLLLNGTKIGDNCVIDAFSVITNSTIHNGATIAPHSVITDSTIESHAQVGPFAHVRNHSVIGEHAAIGNFVEVTKTNVGSNSKAKHLSYLGNGVVGSHVNIGAGTIFCNYNGFTKETTTINDYAYIGSNNALVAPVTIGANAITGAGSVITREVPDNALALGRSSQINKEGYAPILKERLQKKEQGQKTPDALDSFLGALKTTTIANSEEQK